MHNIINILAAVERDPLFGLTLRSSAIYSGTSLLAVAAGVKDGWRDHRRGRLRPEVAATIHAVPTLVVYGLIGLAVGHWRWVAAADRAHASGQARLWHPPGPERPQRGQRPPPSLAPAPGLRRPDPLEVGRPRLQHH
jgi:hypothetical protein